MKRLAGIGCLGVIAVSIALLAIAGPRDTYLFGWLFSKFGPAIVQNAVTPSIWEEGQATIVAVNPEYDPAMQTQGTVTLAYTDPAGTPGEVTASMPRRFKVPKSKTPTVGELGPIIPDVGETVTISFCKKDPSIIRMQQYRIEGEDRCAGETAR